MEGSINLKEYDSKLAYKQKTKEDPVKEYVKNFSAIHHVIKGKEESIAISGNILKRFTQNLS